MGNSRLMSNLWPPLYSDGTRVEARDRVIWRGEEYSVLCLYVDRDDNTNVDLYHPTKKIRVNSRDLERVS